MSILAISFFLSSRNASILSGVKPATFSSIGMLKKGVGTVLATAKNEAALHSLTVADGTWLIGSSDAMTADHAVQLTGGTLGAAAGTTNPVGAVSVADGVTGSLRLDPNAELTLTALSLGTDARLSVTSDVATARLRLLQTLDDATLKRIRVNGKRAAQTADGTVEQGNFGLILLVR